MSNIMVKCRIAGAALALFLSASTLAHADTTLVFNAYLPPQSPVMASSTEWIQAVHDATEGRVQIEYTASSLAPPPRQLDAVRSGVADIAITVNSVIRGQAHLPMLFELPQLSENVDAKAHSIAMWRTYETHFGEAHEFDGVVVLGMYSMTPNHLFFSEPAERLEDIRGRRIRSNPDAASYVDAVEGAMVSQQPPMMHELLSRGVIDGTAMPTWGMPMFDSVHLAPYGFTVPGGFGRSTVSLFINQQAWDSLSEADREAIWSVSGEHFAKRSGEIMNRLADEALTVIEAEGGYVHTATEDDVTTFWSRIDADRMLAEWISGAEARGIDGTAARSYYLEQLAEISAKE